MARGRPSQKQDWAMDIIRYIPAAFDEGQWTGRKELAKLTGLTPPQVSMGVAYIRDNYPEFPLVSCMRGYRFSIAPDEIMKFRTWRARSAHTIIARLYRGVISPYLDQVPNPAARGIRRDFDYILDKIGDIMAVPV